jgi:hypothetical protein
MPTFQECSLNYSDKNAGKRARPKIVADGRSKSNLFLQKVYQSQLGPVED